MNASDLPTGLARAVAAVREGAPYGTVVLLVPGDANGVLARQSLALAGPTIRVEAWTPERLVHHLGALGMAPRQPEPGAWRRATVGVLLRELAAAGTLGSHGETLRLPGWRDVVADALAELESAGVTADVLRAQSGVSANRAHLLATLMDALAERRRAEGLYAPHELAAAALASVGSPAARAVGVVILGDRRLTPAIASVIRTFCERRPTVRVAIAPLSNLPPEPGGLIAAAPKARVVHVAPAGGALGTVQARLFGSPSQWSGSAASQGGTSDAPLDRTLALLRAPDDVREVREAAREVQDAVLAGTPLDRIAVVLPTPERADVWVGELARAGIPATWLTGPPLAQAPTARVLRLFADLAAGDDTVRRWYELLRQPGLRLRGRLGPPGTAGRGRWRRILEQCGAVGGTSSILQAVAAWSEAQATAAGMTPESLVANQEAAASLGVAMRALETELAALRPAAALGVHAGRLAALLEKWWARARDREQVLQLLAGWAASTAGFPFTLSEASDELADALAGTATLEGALGDPTIRVLSPMALLGGSFDVVVVPGLAHARFPVEARESAILPDALITALGAAIPLSNQRVSEDQRRFAAAVASCRGRLVLCWPETDLLDGRPRLPGAFALEAVSAVLGRRAGYREVERTATRVGSRARPHTDDPHRAIGAVEHLLARAASTSPAELTRDLAAHPTARRVLALQRSPAKLADGVRDEWSGNVPEAVRPCPGLDGAPLGLSALDELLRDPSAFFFRRSLGAWPVRRLPDGLDLLDTWGFTDRVLEAVRGALESADPLDDAFSAAWKGALDALDAHAPLDPKERALADALAEAEWRNIRDRVASLRGAACEVPPTPMGKWTIQGLVGIRAGASVVDLSWKAAKPDAGLPRALLAALAASRAGAPVTTAVGAGLDKTYPVALADHTPALIHALTDAHTRATQGHWPWGPRDTFRLADEPKETQ